MEKSKPDYHRIYNDIISMKFPHLKEEYKLILNNKSMSVLNVLEINRKIFGTPTKDTENFNQRHHSYNKSDIIEILDYQKKNMLNNTQLARHFKLSRNTVAKWKKMFLVQL